MSNEEEKWCNQLKKSCELNTDDDFEQYIEAISQLKKSRNPEVLRHMLRCFRDIDAGEIQYELVEACEIFPDNIYVDIFIEESQVFAQKSPRWFELMFQSILNTETCRKLAISKIDTLDKIKREFFIDFVEQLSSHSAKYKNVLRELK